jgi:uncharacterized membrane protein YkvA (DUF1232 family)
MSDSTQAPASKEQATKTLLSHAMTLFSLIRDYWKGDYREVPKLTIGLVLFAVAYIISPIDLIPDVMLGVGQLDDLAVLAIAMKMINTEINRYLEWKAIKGNKTEPTSTNAAAAKIVDV